MNRILFALTLAALLLSFAAAQDNGVPVTLKENIESAPAQPGASARGEPGFVPFCPRGSCLYYAGDWDSNDSNANGLFDANDTGAGLEGQAWVGVKPDRGVTVTGATFVEVLTPGFQLMNPTPFAVQVGIKPGQAGKTVCNTSGNATVKIYQEGQPLQTYSVTIAQLAKPCKLKKGKLYYVNLLPTSVNGYGYVMNVEDKKPMNHYGWKNALNHCYFNGAAFGVDYGTCNSQGAFNELSIALTGKK